MWAAQFFVHKDPQKFISSGGLAQWDTAFHGHWSQDGAAGMRCHRRGGDGSFLMNSQELATAVVNDIPVKVAVLNNGCWAWFASGGAVLREEVLGHHSGPHSPDFVKLAEATDSGPAATSL